MLKFMNEGCMRSHDEKPRTEFCERHHMKVPDPDEQNS